MIFFISNVKVFDKNANFETNKKTMDKESFSWWKIALPTLIGVGVIGYMFAKEFDLSEFLKIRITGTTIFWLGVALLFMIGRDAGFTIRYRYLTQKTHLGTSTQDNFASRIWKCCHSFDSGRIVDGCFVYGKGENTSGGEYSYGICNNVVR